MEALKGIKPIHEIASDREIHPVQVSQWKKELQEQSARPVTASLDWRGSAIRLLT